MEPSTAAFASQVLSAHVDALTLISALPAVLKGETSLSDFYWNADPMAMALLLAAGNALFCIIAGPLSGDYSWVDRLWSLLPSIYVWHFTLRADFDCRLTLMAVLSSLWALRLTYNFARKGGYKVGHEDYRWPVLRQRMSPLAFQVFNVFFISIFQHWLLLAFVSSSYVAYLARGLPLTTGDYLAAGAFLLFFIMEVVSDEQQWHFQTKKYELIRQQQPRTGDFARGFLTHGLFRFCRHPNFFAEQCIWWSFYAFSVAITGQVLNWSVCGPLVLSLLFQGSTSFTEELSTAKYRTYALYQKTTSRLIPWLPGPELDSVTKSD